MIRTLGLFGGMIILAGTLAVFFWLWTLSRASLESYAVSLDLQPVEIETIKIKAKGLLDGRENLSNLPLAVPINKMGRENPFEQP
ncbi:MAG: hypothetical protein AAB360_01795 [Patescibacteria group bacterium]